MVSIFLIAAVVCASTIFVFNNPKLTGIISALFLVIESGLCIYVTFHVDEFDSKYYRFDAPGVLLALVLGALSIATFYHSHLYFRRHQFTTRQESIYYSFLIMLIASMMSAYFAENLALMWVSIETTTLFVSYLIFHERTREAIEASWKYLFVSSFGVAIAFMGILFVSIVASNSGLSDLSISGLLSISGKMNSDWLKIAFLLVITGFSAKMGIFPLHTVAVDAHTVAPPPISAFISTTLMNVGFIGIFRIFTIIAQTEVLAWAQNVLMIAGILSIAMSAVQLLQIKHFKRMFAFSSLEHMGIVAIGLAVGGIGYYAAILQIVFHSFAKASLFYQIGQVHSIYKSYWIKDVGNYFKVNPAGSLALIFGFISILAMPPSGLFISELLIFKGLFQTKQIAIAIIILILLSVIIFVFARHILRLLFSQDYENKIDISMVKINPVETISQYVFLGLIVYLGIFPPDFFSELINKTISIL